MIVSYSLLNLQKVIYDNYCMFDSEIYFVIETEITLKIFTNVRTVQLGRIVFLTNGVGTAKYPHAKE